MTTIQSTVERVLQELEGAPVNVAASGRTDAGVHALAQVAACSLVNPIPVENLRKAMNNVLPGSIRITNVEEVEAQFHPRYDAIAKTYEYRIFRGEICPPFERRYVHHHPYPLNEDRIVELAPLLEGEHDFTAFAATDDKDEKGYSKVRRMFSSRAAREGDLLIYRVRGSGFLKHMVRNIAGVLIEAGKGNLEAESLRRRLEPGCGVPAGPTAPASGLFLVSVEYAAPLHADTRE
jgi:tRNA pseudouridine38-40 synthase